MKYRSIVLLTICVFMIENGSTISLRRILSYEDNINATEHELVPTKISPAEKFLESLLVPIDAIENTTKIVDKGLNSILSNLPESLRKPIEGTFDNRKRGFGEVLNLLGDRFQAIFPGTLWCGAGNIAESEEDLGLFKKTDACCRNHDNCFDDIAAHTAKEGLYNNGIFTRSHCSCDHAFHQCLKDVKSLVALKIGITYFDILSPQCFAEDYPIIGCEKHSSRSIINNKCIDYEKDYNGQKKVQWFDNPNF